MNRRHFIALGVAGLAAAGAAWIAGPRRLWQRARREYDARFGPDEDELVAAFHQEFAYLQLTEGTAAHFVRDYRARSDLYPLTLPLGKDVRVRFLLSTDYIAHKADPSRPVSYAAFYDPYASGCYNPFMAVPRDEVGVVI